MATHVEMDHNLSGPNRDSTKAGILLGNAEKSAIKERANLPSIPPSPF